MDRTPTSHKPIFITGPGRSGKTLLAMLLASHENIAIPRQEIALRLDVGRRRKSASECLADLISTFSLGGFSFPNGPLVESILRKNPSAGEILACVMDQFAALTGKARWAVHSQKWEDEAVSLFNIFPDAKAIHLIRDPRDRYAALKRKPNLRSSPWKLGLTTSEWLHSVQLGRKIAPLYPNNYMMVRYEDLALSPENTLTKVLGFIGESGHQLSVLLDNLKKVQTRGGSQAYGSLSGDHVGIFGTTLDTSETTLLESLAGETMDLCGYHRGSEQQKTMRERLQLVVNRTIASGRIAARQAYCKQHIGRRRVPLSHRWPSDYSRATGQNPFETNRLP